MNTRSFKIFIACALGAGIGSLVALELPKVIWWIGLPVGGLFGYLSYEFRTVLSAINQAWHEIINYRPDPEQIVRRFWKTVSLVSAFGSIILFALLAHWSVWYLVGDPKSPLPIFALVLYNLPFVPWYCKFPDFYRNEYRNEEHEKRLSAASWKRSLRFSNPLTMMLYFPVLSIIYVLKYTGIAVLWILKRILAAVRITATTLWSFVKRVFVLIHSDVRLLCGIDAAIGAGVGYFAGSIIAGMLVGGVLGVVNYEVISKRVLGLVTNK